MKSLFDNIKNLSDIKNIVIDNVVWAEKELSGKSGAEKKAAVIKRLDDMITLPSYLEWIDDIVLAIIVDRVCTALNEFIGHRFADISTAQKEIVAEKVETLDLV